VGVWHLLMAHGSRVMHAQRGTSPKRPMSRSSHLLATMPEGKMKGKKRRILVDTSEMMGMIAFLTDWIDQLFQSDKSVGLGDLSSGKQHLHTF
jgi:hypothetical protein